MAHVEDVDKGVYFFQFGKVHIHFFYEFGICKCLPPMWQIEHVQ